MSSTDRLVEFILGTSWSQIPEEAKEKSKLCLMDALGASIAGSRTRVGEIVTGFVKDFLTGDEATVILNGRASVIGAALANGYMANALDIDDGAKYTRGHPGAQVIPVVLALSEKYDRTGKEALTGIVIAYETAHRVGRCWHGEYEDYRSCGSWGSVVCAGVSAYLMDLSKVQTRHALAIADYNSPYLPMMRAIDQPSMVKHGTGWGAMTGVIAAEWAGRGFTGSSTTLDTEDCESDFDDLGRDYLITDEDAVEFKKIPSCSWAHTPIKATLDLLETHEVSPEDIESVKVEGFYEMAALHSEVPETIEEAQFNVKWPLAVALVDGGVSTEGMSEDRFDDEDLISMADRIEVKESKELTRMNRSITSEKGETVAWPARVTVKTLDGKVVNSGIVLSEPASNASFSDLAAKFKRLSSPHIGSERASEILDRVENFDRLNSVFDLTLLLESR